MYHRGRKPKKTHLHFSSPGCIQVNYLLFRDTNLYCSVTPLTTPPKKCLLCWGSGQNSWSLLPPRKRCLWTISKVPILGCRHAAGVLFSQQFSQLLCMKCRWIHGSHMSNHIPNQRKGHVIKKQKYESISRRTTKLLKKQIINIRTRSSLDKQGHASVQCLCRHHLQVLQCHDWPSSKQGAENDAA